MRKRVPMPYTISSHPDHLLWVVMEGHLALPHAECYFHEMWGLLDELGGPTDLLVDGRRIAGAALGARRRTEEIAHHPNLGHLAFVVSEHHLLIFAPLVKLVSGVGMFGNESEAVGYLRAARGLPSFVEHAFSEHVFSEHVFSEPTFPDPPAPPVVALPPPAVARTPLPTTPDPLRVALPELPPLVQHQRAVGARHLPPLPASRLKQTPLFPGHMFGED